MREIKFKAWNEKEKIMPEPFSLFEYVEGSQKNKEMMKEGSAFFPIDTLFLQFTGLKDKNGKDIYEGDIVQSENYILGEIVWNPHRAHFEMIDPQKEIFFFDDHYCPEDIEIIGNKFENPELLESSQ